MNTIRVSNVMGPDQDRCPVGPDLGLNCLQRSPLAWKESSVLFTGQRQTVKTQIRCCKMQDEVSDLCLHCLPTGTSIKSEIELIFFQTHLQR